MAFQKELLDLFTESLDLLRVEVVAIRNELAVLTVEMKHLKEDREGKNKIVIAILTGFLGLASSVLLVALK